VSVCNDIWDVSGSGKYPNVCVVLAFHSGHYECYEFNKLMSPLILEWEGWKLVALLVDFIFELFNNFSLHVADKYFECIILDYL